MEISDLVSGAFAAVVGSLAGFVSSFYLNRGSQRANEAFARRNKSVDLNLEMHKEFVSLMGPRIAVWKAFKDKQVKASDPEYSDLWLIGNFYIRLAYLIDAGLLDARDAGKLHGTNAWWWHCHFFDNDRTKALNEQNEIGEVMRAWELLCGAASKDDMDVWEHTAKSYD